MKCGREGKGRGVKGRGRVEKKEMEGNLEKRWRGI